MRRGTQCSSTETPYPFDIWFFLLPFQEWSFGVHTLPILIVAPETMAEPKSFRFQTNFLFVCFVVPRYLPQVADCWQFIHSNSIWNPSRETSLEHYCNKRRLRALIDCQSGLTKREWPLSARRADLMIQPLFSLMFVPEKINSPFCHISQDNTHRNKHFVVALQVFNSILSRSECLLYRICAVAP